MLVIKGLSVISPLKSFERFDNMFRTVEMQEFDNNYNSTYIAILVFDKVALEGDPMRTNEADTWLNGGWYPEQCCIKYNYGSDEESISDISD